MVLEMGQTTTCERTETITGHYELWKTIVLTLPQRQRSLVLRPTRINLVSCSMTRFWSTSSSGSEDPWHLWNSTKKLQR